MNERPIRGPFAFAIVHPGDGWPLSNLHRDGCKHDVRVMDLPLIEQQDQAIPCVKCGCLLIPVNTVWRAIREYEREWNLIRLE